MLVQVIITTIFFVSGTAKLVDLESFRRTIVEVGVHVPRSRWVAWSLPILEISSSGAMLFEHTRVVGYIVALGLMGIFALVTWHVLRLKAEIKCNCFGTLVPENLGPVTFAKQGILSMGIIVVLVDGTPFSWTSVLVLDWISSISSAVGVILLYVLLANYFHHKSVSEKRD